MLSVNKLQLSLVELSDESSFHSIAFKIVVSAFKCRVSSDDIKQYWTNAPSILYFD